ncbi:hypothetical protein ABB02_01238 [Clostridiaceae bacterium JG1575]|nr:hypothetical protein ABB02_01238 [Clostridiaceae bacterium JG1575]
MTQWRMPECMEKKIEEVHQRMLRCIPSEGRLAQIAKEVTVRRGKMLRPALLLAVAGADAEEEDTLAVGAAIEYLHMASLIHDDIIDGATQRRSAPSVVARHGLAMALYCGDYLICLALRCLSEVDRSLVPEKPWDFMTPLLEAEAEQLSSRFFQNITKEHYLERIEAKTGALFALACAAGGTLRRATPKVLRDLRKGGLAFGIAFQLRDDVLDLLQNPGEDLQSGTYTLPVFLALEEDPRLKDRLSSASPEEVSSAIQKTRAIERTKGIMQEQWALALKYLRPHLAPENAVFLADLIAFLEDTCT